MVGQSRRVSVILPTYNRANVIDRSIESVLRQSFGDYNLLVIDDASTDDTDEVIHQFSDDRIRYIEHGENRGPSAARNTGIQEAEGDIIAFQDSDDIWDDQKLEKQITAFENSPDDVGVVYTGTRRESGDSQTYIPGRGVDPKEGDIQESILESNFVTTQAAAVRSECFDHVGLFDEGVPALVDWELWIRLSEFYKFKFIDEPLVTAYMQPDSISHDYDALVQARERIVQKHRERFDDETLARQLFYVGHGALKLGDTRKGRGYLRLAIEYDPRILYLGAFGLSLFGSRAYRGVYDRYKDDRAER